MSGSLRRLRFALGVRPDGMNPAACRIADRNGEAS